MAQKGLTLEDLFPGRFVKACDFKGKAVTLTIAGVELAELPDEKTGGDVTRGVLSFKERPKKMVLNRTNAESLVAMFGKQVDGWTGRAVTLYPEKVRYGKEIVDGIRVKGSPELKDPIAFELKLPRKRPITVKLIPTVRGAATPAEQAPAATDGVIA